MRTQLDDTRYGYLHGLTYAGEVVVELVAGVVSGAAETLQVGEAALEGLRPIAWQVVDESCTAFDESEVRDDLSTLQVLTKSTYLDHVQAQHGWYAELEGPARHDRLCTLDELFDVVALEPPSIESTRIESTRIESSAAPERPDR